MSFKKVKQEMFNLKRKIQKIGEQEREREEQKHKVKETQLLNPGKTNVPVASHSARWFHAAEEDCRREESRLLASQWRFHR